MNGIKLNYLDWGGDGPPLVMMHRIGDDPQVFDDLALLLRDLLPARRSVTADGNSPHRKPRNSFISQ